MKTTRKRYSADFKAKVALEAIRGDLTLAELAAKHGVHHTMIASWKRQVIDGMASTYPRTGLLNIRCHAIPLTGRFVMRAFAQARRATHLCVKQSGAGRMPRSSVMGVNKG